MLVDDVTKVVTPVGLGGKKEPHAIWNPVRHNLGGRLAQGHAFGVLRRRPGLDSREGVWAGVSVSGVARNQQRRFLFLWGCLTTLYSTMQAQKRWDPGAHRTVSSMAYDL